MFNKVNRQKNTFLSYYLRGFSAYIVIFFLFFASASYSATYYSKASGNWGTSSTWGTSCGGGGNQTPAAGDNVVICSGYTVTLNASKSITAITVNSGGVLVCAGSYTLTVSGATAVSGIFNMSAGACNSAGAFTVASGGVFNFSGGTLNSAGNLVVDGTMNVSNGTVSITGATGTDNLLVNGALNQSGGTISNSQFTSVQSPGVFTLSGGSLNCTKVFKLKSGGVFNISNGSIFISGGISSNNSLDRINQSGGIIQFDNSALATWLMTGIFNATAGTVVFNGTPTTLTYSGSVASWSFFNLTINSGKTFDQNSVVNINVKGIWTNTSGTYTHSGQRVTFNGSAAQSITGTTGTTFDSLTINNSSTTGVTLLKPVTISTILTLTDGYVYTDATNLMIISNNASSTSGSSNSFVSGPMKKVGNDPFVFPVGSAGIWARLEMVNDTNFLYYNATTEFTCQYYNTAAPYNSNEYMAGTIEYVSYKEYWDLERTYDTANNAQCNVRLYWEDATRSGINDNEHLLLAHFNSSAGYYEDQLGIASGGSSGSILSTVPLTSFSPFTFGTDTTWISGINPLPIELVSFNVKANGSAVDLNWTTASETNNDFFTVEKTKNGVDFEIVGTAKGAGNSTSILNYFLVDNTPLSQGSGGEVYYRLKQTDFDGHITYSDLEVVVIENNSDLTVAFYPNPCDGNSINILLNSDVNEEILLVLSDVYGNKIYSKVIAVSQNSENVHSVDFSQKLIPGVYVITVTSNNATRSSKLFVD